MIKKFKLFESKEKVLYSAVVLDKKSKNKLLNYFDSKIPNDWKKIAHHMTIAFGKGLDYLNLEDDKNKIVDLIVTHLGISDMAIAVKVKGYKSTNKIPHITLAVNINEGGKPVMSNKITDWVRTTNLTLTGKVTEILN